MSINKYVRRDNNRRDRDHDILGIVLIIISIFLLLCTIIPIMFGIVSQVVQSVILGVLGVFAYAVLAFVLACGIVLLMHRRVNISGVRIALICGIVLSLMLILQLATTQVQLNQNATFGTYMGYVYNYKFTAGGIIFGLIAYGIQALITPVASYIVYALILIACTAILIYGIVKKNRGRREKPEKSVSSDFTEDRPPQRVHMHSPTTLFVDNIIGKTEPTGEEPRGRAISAQDSIYGRNIDTSYALHQLYDAPAQRVGTFDESFPEIKPQRTEDEYNKNIKSYAPSPLESVPDVHTAETTEIPPTRPSRVIHSQDGFNDVVIPKQKQDSGFINSGVIMNTDRAIRDGIMTPAEPVYPTQPEPISEEPPEEPYRPMAEPARGFTPFGGQPSERTSEPENKPTFVREPARVENTSPIVTTAMLADLLRGSRKDEPKEEAPAPKAEPTVAPPPPERKPSATFTSFSSFGSAEKSEKPVSEQTERKASASVMPEPSSPLDSFINPAYLHSEPVNAEPEPITAVPEQPKVTAEPFAPVPEEEPEEIATKGAEEKEEEIAPIVSADTFTRVSDTLKIEETVIDKTETDKDFDDDNSGYYVSAEDKVKHEKTKKILPGQMDMDSISTGSSSAVELPPPVEPYEYTYPPISLLENRVGDATVDEEDIEAKSREIEEVLASLKFPAKVVNVISGPTVTRYELQPPPGISVRKILSLDKDLEFSLARGAIRIEAPVTNKQAIGVEVASSHPTLVSFREIVESSAFADAKSVLPMALGKDIGGDAIVRNLEKMPHLLIAGATGMGKSVCLNTLIMSLLYKRSPEDVRIILVDPKQVEFTLYRELPHLLLRNPITNVDHAINALQWLIDEMNNRFDIFSNASMKGYVVRNLAEYNNSKLVTEGKARKMPYIVMIVDELADLMSMRKKDVENRIRIITQKSRAAGIHLVLATQRPSVDIITGTIKVNLPTRIAFKVTSVADSRTILDQMGAEALLGNGDMLLTSTSEPIRLQGAYVSNEEIVSVVDYIKSHNKSEYDENIENVILANKEQPADVVASDEGDDPNADEVMYPEIMRSLITSGMASTSMLQRRFKFGYARASRIIDVFEQRRWVGPYAGSKPREILMTEAQFEEVFGTPFNE